MSAFCSIYICILTEFTGVYSSWPFCYTDMQILSEIYMCLCQGLIILPFVSLLLSIHNYSITDLYMCFLEPISDNTTLCGLWCWVWSKLSIWSSVHIQWHKHYCSSIGQALWLITFTRSLLNWHLTLTASTYRWWFTTQWIQGVLVWDSFNSLNEWFSKLHIHCTFYMYFGNQPLEVHIVIKHVLHNYIMSILKLYLCIISIN